MTQIAKVILNKKKKGGKFIILGFNMYHTGIIIKISWPWFKDSIDQWNKIEDPNMSIHNHNHLKFDYKVKNTHWRIDSIFHNLCCENCRSICRRMKLVRCLSCCTKKTFKVEFYCIKSQCDSDTWNAKSSREKRKPHPTPTDKESIFFIGLCFPRS